MNYSAKAIKTAKDSFIRKVPGDGKKGPFYNCTQPWEFIVDDEELFRNAVWQGYLDASRTFSGIKGKKTDRNCGAFKKLADAIRSYFEKNDDFNHKKWCEDFISDMKEFYDYDARYGQAQKVVNMAFKYLYCCEGAEKYKDKFDKCHMPLDQYTLAWLFSEGEPYYQEWSWFDYDTYKEVNDRIREILKTDILDKELVIWESYKGRIVNLKTKYKK